MARGAASPDDSSSSSCFSSDEGIVDVSVLVPAESSISNVHIEMLDENEESVPKSSATTLPNAPQSPIVHFDVLQCCQDVSDPILQTLKPLDMQYEQYTAAISHVTCHWPTSESVPTATKLEKRICAYHSLRAELYKAFQKVFPLTEDMYTQWINDSSARGDTVEELKRLFELAQGDYWSVPLTLQHLRFIKENGDEQELETAMTRAQSTVGTHFARGHEVWALCREFTAEKYAEVEEDVELQKEKAIRKLFCKQMELPLDQNDLVMSEFRAWDAYNSLDAEASGSAFEESSKRQSKLFAPLMKKLRGFEARISAQDATAPEQAWQQYLNFVKHRVAPLMSMNENNEGKQLVVCLYERALSVMCLSPSLWISYLDYLEPDQANGDNSKHGDKLAVARRAVRNVPFDSAAWTELVIAMERQSTGAEKISQLMRTQLLARSSSPMEPFHLLGTLLTWCDSIRRYTSSSIDGESLEDTVQQVEVLIGGIFSECEQFMSKMFPDFLEGKMRLAEYQAKCYWALMPPVGSPRRSPTTAMKVSKVRELWQKTLCTRLGDQAVTWIAYLDALRRMNAFSVENIRKMVFDEAVQHVKDAPIVLAESWLLFERENGDLTHYLRARRYHVKHSASGQVPTQDTPCIMNSTHIEEDKKAKGAKKRKVNAIEGKKAQNFQKQPIAKRMKPTSINTEGGQAMEVDETKASKSEEKKKMHETLTNEHTLFLCNVSKEASKEDIETLFRDIPTLKDVRLVVKMRGDRIKSRGMAYVQFSDDAGAETGLKKDGVLLHGHPLRIERSKPPSTSASTPTGKSSGGENFWKTDPLTLYVGGLNREGSKEQVTEEQLQVSLQQAMQTAGELVVVNRVSILKDRHGRLKNYGLVEVAEPSQVDFCLASIASLQAKMGDQVTMKPSRFSINHIFEQQEKQKKLKQQRKGGAAISGGRVGAASKDSNAPHFRPSTRLALPSTGSTTSLMPRALRRKLAAQNSASKTESSKVAASTATVTPKSNEDFRKMLFNK